MMTRTMKVLLSAVLGLALVGDMGPASAALVTWHLQNVRFEDGGTATGTFVYNTEGHPPDHPADLLQSFDINVSRGNTSVEGQPIVEPFEYTCHEFSCAFFSANPSGSGTGESLTVEINDIFFRRGFTLSFSRPLPDTGGTVALDIFPLTNKNTGGFSREFIQQEGAGRLVVSGEVTTIPEPSEALLLAPRGCRLGSLFGLAQSIAGCGSARISMISSTLSSKERTG
jgi:hypothetical protein